MEPKRVLVRAELDDGQPIDAPIQLFRVEGNVNRLGCARAAILNPSDPDLVAAMAKAAFGADEDYGEDEVEAAWARTSNGLKEDYRASTRAALAKLAGFGKEKRDEG